MNTFLTPRDAALWEDAKPYLDVRNNDEHTLVAYAVAQQLLKFIPEADESTVLPAILLHDVGWKHVPQELLLDAIGRHPKRPDLVCATMSFMAWKLRERFSSNTILQA
jgi:hypothetical protein